MIRVLSIGNSFSQDAQRYLHLIAQADGVELKCVNLYIGGCSLSTHYKHMHNDAKAYRFEFNGENTNIFVTMKEGLQSDDWDYITFQQVSGESPRFETYTPYLEALSDYAKLHAPKSKQLLHQTWSYEQGSERLNQLGYQDQKEMFHDVKAAYEQAKRTIQAEGIIPSGACMQHLLENGLKTVHRDAFHADLGVARYAIALTWYGFLTGNDLQANALRNFDQPISEEELELAKKSAMQALEKN